jgi:two-component system sensor histidine kinase BaeS
LKLKLSAKLFLAVLTSILVLLGAVIGSEQWSFRRGLADYLHRVEIERLGKLVANLASAYREEGGWEFLREDHHRWMELLRQSLGNGAAGSEPHRPPPPRGSPARDHEPSHGFGPPPDDGPPPHHEPPPGHGDPLGLIDRLRLLDAGRNMIAGPPWRPEGGETETLVSVEVDGRVAGWLGLAPSGLITDRLALDFLEQQAHSRILVLGLGLLIAVVASLLLARHLLAPIRRIAAATRALAGGHYAARIDVSGGDEIADLGRDFNLLAKTLAGNEEARRQWVADISHELRTPLSILRGEIEALQDGIRTVTPERIRSLHGEVLALSRLVDDLYQLSLSDLGGMDYRWESLDLGELVAEAMADFAARFQERGVRLDDPPQPGAELAVLGDRRRLRQLLANLLENSCRYTDAGGSCRIQLARESGRAVLQVDDAAPGVPPQSLPRLFERLYRVDASRSREHGGAGLGLAICRNIVDAHGGTIGAAPSPLGGLRIRVELPLRTGGAP